MPTGYTTNVQDGTITELRPFALQCARAFGALILMRDSPSDTPIPSRFEPETKYHDEKLAEAVARRAELLGMTPEEVAAGTEAAYQDELASYQEMLATTELQRERYQAMSDKVSAWQPPETCLNLKKFMLEQLKTSVEHDLVRYREKPVRRSVTEWLGIVKEAERDIAYHREGRAEEIARTEERNLWLDALRVSLL